MPTYTVYANDGCIVKQEYPTQHFSLTQTFQCETNNKRVVMLCGFPLPATNLRFKRITGLKAYIYFRSGALYYGRSLPDGYLIEIKERQSFSLATYNSVTFGSKSSGTMYSISASPSYAYGIPPGNYTDVFEKGIGAYLAYISTSTDNPIGETPAASNKPYLEVEYTDETVGLTPRDLMPGDGYVNRHQDNVFAWTEKQLSQTAQRVAATSTVLKWRQGSSGTVHTISAGTGNTVTVPADTFPAGEIQWSVEITANSGVVTSSDWKTISTTEETSSAAPMSPVGQIIDGTAESVFRWQHIISTGTQPTGADLQKSQDGTNWTNLKSVFGAATETTIPANTFTAGTWYWRVRTYNTDEVEGSWSEAAQIIVIAAPDAPGIYVERSAPNWMIRWQQSGQQAYEIRLDGEKIAAGFGQQSNYAYDSWTEPGSHTVEVRIQSIYSMWSPWGTATLQITNTPGPGITLVAEASDSAPESLLTWNGGDYDRFIVYRDGKKIGETEETSFTDHFGAGAVSYQVRGVYDDTGFYGLSNSATLTIQVPELSIYDVTTGNWLSIELSEVQSRALNGSVSRAAAFLHFAGTEKPSVEFGEAIDRVISFDCAFRKTDAVSAAAFEAMLGHTVCLKLQTGETIIGALTAYSCKYTSFYEAFSSAVTETEFSEVDANG